MCYEKADISLATNIVVPIPITPIRYTAVSPVSPARLVSEEPRGCPNSMLLFLLSLSWC
jgi:hypothetical protein